jgi:hypothetical protein
MTGARSAAGALLRGIDLLPWAVGGTLLWLGVPGRPGVTLAGSLVLLVAGVLYFASVNGYQLPRLGLARITSLGCGDPPAAFFVRHRNRGLLFHRAFEPVPVAAPESYAVVAVPDHWDGTTALHSSFQPPEDSRLLGLVLVADLVFAHRGGAYVDRASLVGALDRLRDELSPRPAPAARP